MQIDRPVEDQAQRLRHRLRQLDGQTQIERVHLTEQRGHVRLARRHAAGQPVLHQQAAARDLSGQQMSDSGWRCSGGRRGGARTGQRDPEATAPQAQSPGRVLHQGMVAEITVDHARFVDIGQAVQHVMPAAHDVVKTER